ncbi:hypothetical protein JKF63_03854 [Porcisia hertigi]|uniref:Uncharacterized protein n=1 Tax=Porcisia hertigi TaxID=2761500 RepID=A0A836HU34_9TRYP|nr:hypothetical protein JKF63_03854 [Porcisia hertigi]
MLPAVDSVTALRKLIHPSDSSARASNSGNAVSPSSTSSTTGKTPARLWLEVLPPQQQPAVTQPSPSDALTTRQPSVRSSVSPPGAGSETSPMGLLSKTAVPSPPSFTTTITSRQQHWTGSKPCLLDMAVDPPSSTPLPAMSIPSPIFSAMELVPKQRGFLFRVFKRCQSAYKEAKSTSGRSTPRWPSSNGGNDATETEINGIRTTGARNRISGTTTSSFRPVNINPSLKDRHAHSERTGGSAHGKRREPAAMFSPTVNESPRCAQNNASIVSDDAPPFPQRKVNNLSSLGGNVGTSPTHIRLTNGTPSDPSEASDTEDVVPLDNPSSTRRLPCSGTRLATPRTASRAPSNCSLSLDDVPRPLTRHASTLSTAQQEALRKTPSFISRIHTPPPPPSLTESVQLRKGCRVLRAQCDSPDVHTSASGARSVNEQSLSSTSTVIVSEPLPSTVGHVESRVFLSARGDNCGLPLADNDNDSVLSPWPSKKPPTTVFGVASPIGSSTPGTQSSTTNDRGAAEPKANGAALQSVATASLDFPKSSCGKTITSPQPNFCVPSPPPLSSSLASRTASAPEIRSELEVATSSPPATKTSATGNMKSDSVPSVNQDLPKNPSTGISLLLDKSAAFDYYSTYRLFAQQFNTKPQHYIAATLTPIEESASIAAIDEVARTHLEQSQQGPQLQTPDTSRNDTLNSIAVNPQKENDVNISASGGADLSRSDLCVTSSVSPTAEGSDARAAGRSTSPLLPIQKKSRPNDEQVVQPANRRCVVSAHIDIEEDTCLTTSTTGVAPTSASLELQGTSCGVPLPVSASPSVTGFNYSMALPPSSTKPSTAQFELSSDNHDDDDDDSEDEEEPENVLEGFYPAGFDARRGARSGSSIVFYLHKGDSVNSLDIVVSGTDNACATAATLPPLFSSKTKPLYKPPQSEYSMLKLCTTEATRCSNARPHVTFDPYIMESAHLLGHRMVPVPSSTPADSHKYKDLISATDLDSYSVLVETSTPSAQLSANGREPKTPISGHSASESQNKPLSLCAPTSIFLGTTARFAPDKNKMHCPSANTFGHTNVQRCAPATVIATRVVAEDGEQDVGMNKNHVNSEEGVYGEVYTDENGDEWYWEEVEDEDENASDTECPLLNCGAVVDHSVKLDSVATGVTVTRFNSSPI